MRSLYKITLLLAGAVWLLLAVGCARTHEKVGKNQTRAAAETGQSKAEEKSGKTPGKVKSASLGFYEVFETDNALVRSLCVKENKCPLGVGVVRRSNGERPLLIKLRPIATEKDTQFISAGLKPASHEPVINFMLSEAGARTFCDYTTSHLDKPFAVVLNGKLVSAPTVNAPICNRRGFITGPWSLQEAQNLVDNLNAGIRRTKERVVPENN